MPDPKDPIGQNPQNDPLLDPSQLPTGFNPSRAADALAIHRLSQTKATARRKPAAIPPPPPPKPITLLYPILLAACPTWTYGLQGRGDCMAWSCCHVLDTDMATNILLRHRDEQWRALTCIEAQYGFMRVEIRGGQPDYSGDGASPGPAAAATVEIGSLHRLEYLDTGYDLTEYDDSGGRSGLWGRYGVPDALEPIAAQHKCEDAILVETYEHAVELIASGYAVSNASTTNPIYRTRDDNGYGKDPWNAAHAMNYIGYRTHPTPALLKINWGHGKHVTGPHYPENIPDVIRFCSAWEPKPVVKRILKERWSWTYTGYHGFPARDLTQITHLRDAIHPT